MSSPTDFASELEHIRRNMERILAKRRLEDEQNNLFFAEKYGPQPLDTPCVDCGTPLPATRQWDDPDPGWRIHTRCFMCEEVVRRYEDRLQRLGVTDRERSMTFDAFKPQTPSQREALEAVQAGGSVWLHGRPGVGKSHLALAAALDAIHTHRYLSDYAGAADSFRALRFPALELMDILRTEARDPDNNGATLHAVCTADLLVLDDLDAPRATDFALEQWHRIADARYSNELRTIITSNRPPKDLALQLGERVRSRLVGLCTVVAMEGPDGRRSR
jgi:DNA replication protein DnaC